ncbi:MAG: PD40 domain-containing protein, partial [Bacteroidales bacterium]|nr:PD40 domain-containing protein [Bacteroidales bacterium]
MRELVKIVLVLAFLLSLCVGNLSAQYAKLVDSKKYSKTEMSLFNASVGYFESGDYTNAYMGFSQLHSWYASDPVFSYYCGASMVMLRTEYDKAIKYLTLAYDNKLYDADYYLGLAYHRKYLFSKSITFYSRYRDYLVQATKGKSPKIAEVETLMEKANKARALGQESYVLKVISNNKVKRSNFHFSYGRKILDGNIVVKPDFFRQRNDKNNKDIDLVYVLDTIAFVSSYGSDMKTGLDLYVSRKTDEGWSPLHLLPGNINTDSDEAFPFLASDKTLYFASKGHNSIGGYDIFKSVYDSESGHWGEPENLGFPINTPYDDFMYAVESNGNSAFFASDRSSKDGQVMVCRYIVEETPEKLHIETEEHLAEQAELPITPGAEAEYNRIVQEQQSKANEVKDSTVENKEVKHEIDTTDLFATTKSMLEEKVSAISNYQDYSRKLNAYARITSNKIRAIRNGESDADMSPSDITKMANSVVTYYDLSQKFNSVYSTAKPTLDYCTKEMSFLDKLETGSGEYQFKLQNLNISVEKVNAKSPLEALIEEKKNERKQADDALKKLSRNMGKIQRSLSGINKDLEAKMLVIQNETDPVLREKYINEHKALENSKIDVISSKKNMDVEAKRLNAMMARADETIRMLEDIEDILANLDLSELDETEDIGANDILALQNFISDEDNKEIAEYEKEVENDESLYSEKIDYEAIAANNSSALTDIVNEVAEYKGDMSKSTSAVVGMIVQSDSLYSQKSRFEAQFDAAESDEEKKELLGKINATQKQIDERGKAIESGLVYEPNSSVSKAIDDFNSIKQEKVNSSDWPELVSSTQNLIEKSRKLESQISESKSEANAGVDKAKLLEKIKSDIDNQIVDNVEEMQGIVVAQQSGKKDIAAMNAEIARIRSAAKDKNAETEVKKDLNSASKKVVESKQGGSSSVTTLNDAENILAGAVEKRIAILNEEYEAESQVYDVLAGKYVKSKSTESQKQQADVIYYSALEDRQQAESVTDEVEKMKYLSEANKKMKSANSALLQVVSSVSKPEMQQEDVLTQDILSLYDDIKEQKGVSSPAEPFEASVSQSTSGQNVTESSVDKSGTSEVSGKAQLQTSVTLQTTLANRIATNTTEISDIETNLATASRTDRKRLQTELGEVTTERNGNVRSLGEEKQRFYSELDKAVNEEISKSAVSAEYANRYADYRQSLYSLTTAEPSDENIPEKLTEAEKSEYAL